MARPFDQRLTDAATERARHGVLTTADLTAAGLNTRAVTRRVKAGVLRRKQHGVYLVPGATDQWTLLALAVARRPETVLGGRTAAALWDLDGCDRPAPVLLTRPDRGKGTSVERRGFQVTLPAATLAGLLRRTGDLDLVERALECFLRRRLVRMDELTGTLGCVLNRRGRHHPATESDAETLFVQVLRRAGLPDPVRQHELGDRCRLDFWFGPEVGGPLAVEIDGAATHAGAGPLQYDLNRQNHVMLSGVSVLRFTHGDVTERPGHTAQQVRRALQAGAPRLALGSMRAPMAALSSEAP